MIRTKRYPEPTGPMLASFLETLGFAAMAADASTTTEPERLERYARIVLRQTPETFAGKRAMRDRFALLGLI